MVIDRLDFGVNTESVKDMILKNMDLEQLKSKGSRKVSNSEKIDYSKVDETKLSGAQLIEHQKRQLEELEEEEANKRLIEEEKKRAQLKEEQERKQKEQLAKENQQKKACSVPAEPEQSSETTHIVFRYPHSDLRKERRFLRSTKIQVLYDFVSSLGTEIFEESGEFELLQPFPMKIYSDMEKTLQEENLYPNAVLQIREV